MQLTRSPAAWMTSWACDVDASEPLRRTIQSVQFTDNEIRRLTKNASIEAARILKALEGATGPGAQVKRLQLGMAKLNAEMWGGIAGATKIGIGDAVWNATEMQALFDEKLFARAGFSSMYWRQAMISQAKVGVDSLISRKSNGFTLSQRVYKNTALSKGYVDRAINNGLLLGKSPRDIAKDVIGFINPNVAGGASYAAMRLARTEVVNAYHATSVRNYQNTPWIDAAKWNLSSSHGDSDECDAYADDAHIPGGEGGVYPTMDIPDKPHPSCLCVVTPIMMDADAYVKAFKDGKFDDYIGKQMGCYSVA